MKRRQRRRSFLVAAATVGVAGCLGNDGTASESPEDEASETPTATPTATATPVPEPTVDDERAHDSWASANGDEFEAYGWTRTEDVRVTVDGDSRQVEPDRTVFFQVTAWGDPFGDVALDGHSLVIPGRGTYQSLRTLPDGTSVGNIDDVGEHTLEPQSADSSKLSPIFDVDGAPGEETVYLDISQWVTADEAPRYLRFD